MSTGRAVPTYSEANVSHTLNIDGELLTAAELAARLRVRREAVYDLVRAGVPCFRTSRGSRAEFRFDAQEVFAWLRVQAPAPEADASGPLADADVFAERRFIGVPKSR
jgi:Arc/MetJ family transcription regulator